MELTQVAASAVNVVSEVVMVYLVYLDPDVASAWLARNTRNRSVTPRHIDALSQEIRNGKWGVDGSTIAFDTLGRLFDGQHRLHAVVKTGIAIRTLLVTGINPERFAGKDGILKRRNVKDVLSIMGEKNRSHLASSLTYIYSLLEGRTYELGKERRLCNSSVQEFFAQHPDIGESVRFFDRVRKLAVPRGLVSPQTLVSLHYLFSRKDAAQAEAFFEQLVMGTGLERGDPVWVLRRRLEHDRNSTSSLPVEYKSAIIIKTWNAVRKGKRPRAIAWKREAEEFPEIL